MYKTLMLLLGVILGALSTYWYLSQSNSNTQITGQSEKKPLYWVAPMDANFRRNEPGLSPMGMELVPVYEEQDGEPGMLRIAPNVVQNLGIKTAPVAKMPLLQAFKTVAKTRYNQDLMAHVHPRVSGWINQLHFKSPGLLVQRGEPLFTLYSLELVNAQEEYLLALESKRSNLIEAGKNKLRALNLDNNTIDRIAQNHKSEQYITFFAPQDGVISHLNVSEGEFVEPRVEIMSLAKLNVLWLEIELTEQQLSAVSLGDDVSIQFNTLPQHNLEGEIDFIYPYLNDNSNTAMARLTLNNLNGLLKPNMIADVTVTPNDPTNTLAVPKSSVIRMGKSNRVVWSPNPGEYKSVNVELGRSNDLYIEVIAGLEIGDQVVTSAQFLLDSESSRSSDLSRYEITDTSTEVPSARVFGVIKSITGNDIIIDREAIEKWGRPAATVDFILLQHKQSLSVGQKIDFTFEIKDGQFLITEIHQVLGGNNHD